MCLCVCVCVCVCVSLSLFLSLSLFSLSLSLSLSFFLSLFPFVRWPQNKIDRLDGFILIGRGLAKRRAACYKTIPLPKWCSCRLDLVREGGHFYAGAQCRAFFRVTDTFQWSCARSYDFCCTFLEHVKHGVALLFQVKGMLMISKHFGDLDICVPERSEDAGAAACFGGSVCWLLMFQCQVPMNTLRKQVPKLGLDLCQRTDQTLHVPGITVVRPVGSSQRRLRMFEAVGCTYLSAMGCIGVCPGFV